MKWLGERELWSRLQSAWELWMCLQASTCGVDLAMKMVLVIVILACFCSVAWIHLLETCNMSVLVVGTGLWWSVSLLVCSSSVTVS